MSVFPRKQPQHSGDELHAQHFRDAVEAAAKERTDIDAATEKRVSATVTLGSPDDETVIQVGEDLRTASTAQQDLGRAAAVVEPVVPMTAAAPSLLVSREAEVNRLVALLDPRRDGASAVVVSKVEGLAGVGKTALVRRAASIAAGQDWFPGAALFVDLHGYDCVSRVNAGQLFGPLLLSLGLASTQVPHMENDQAAVYHQVLNELSNRGRPVLMVLDNVSSATQITGLLPRQSAHRVLVTSRNALSSLDGARSLRLRSLSVPHSVALLDAALRRQDPGDKRIVQQSECAADLARLCAGLPLALQIVAALLGRDQALVVEDLVSELAVVGSRLASLTDGERAVRQAFDSSWQNLYEQDFQAAALIRLLALNPGPDMSSEAAAALAGEALPEVRRRLRVLDRANLIEPEAGGRWRMHDLVREYARQRAEQEIPAADRRAALERLARFCYGSVNYAFDKQNPGNLMVDAEFLPAWKHGAADGVNAVDRAGKPGNWFERERSGLLAMVRAGEMEQPPLAITPRLACSLFYFLERGGHFSEWQQAEQSAAQLAFAGADKHDQARSLRNRGRLALVAVLEEYERVRDNSEPSPAIEDARLQAIDLLELSRRYYQEEYADHQRRRDRAGEATTMRELADAYRLGINPVQADEGQIDAAITAYIEAEAIYKALHNDNGLASLWLALGTTHTLAGNYKDAHTLLHKALDYGFPGGEGSQPQHARLVGYALRRVGDLRLKQDNIKEAIENYQRSAEVFAEDGDPIGAGRALAAAGQAEAARGNYAEARQSLETARQYFVSRPLGNNDPEATVLTRWLQELPGAAK